MELYGFMGNMGSGKNYVAEKLFAPNLPPKPTLIMALADHLKVSAICFENLKYEKVFGDKDETTRIKLQKLGTEYGRDKYGDDIWIKVLQTWIKIYQDRGIERFIITDVRFENEAAWIRKNGILIKISAPDRYLDRLNKESDNDHEKAQRLANHRSEIYVKEFCEYDYLINNSKENEKQVLDEVKKIILML
jgi:hypothetical protein